MENKIEDATLQQPMTAFPSGNGSDTGLPTLDLGKRIEITFLSMGYRSLREVRCVCTDGCAVLTGRTKTFYQKQVAQVIAGKVAGVTGIENLIEVDE